MRKRRAAASAASGSTSSPAASSGGGSSDSWLFRRSLCRSHASKIAGPSSRITGARGILLDGALLWRWWCTHAATTTRAASRVVYSECSRSMQSSAVRSPPTASAAR
eukprot:672864-Prymnesium_polylepis.1